MRQTLIIVALCLLCLLATSPRTATGQSLFADPELPRVYLDTSYPLNSTPPKFVATSAALRTAIVNAVPGDTITLDPAATFIGSFELPEKATTGLLHAGASPRRRRL